MAGSRKNPAHRPSRRPLILRAALEELCVVGAWGGELASMAPIGDRAGVTAAAMYYHFKSKSDLLVALVAFVEPEIGALWDEADAAGGPEEWSAALIDRFGRWVREDPAAARFFFVTAPSVAAPEVHTVYDRSQHELAHRFTGTLRRFHPDVDELTLWTRAMAVLALLQEVVTTSLQHHVRVGRGFAATERSAREIARAVVCGV